MRLIVSLKDKADNLYFSLLQDEHLCPLKGNEPEYIETRGKANGLAPGQFGCLRIRGDYCKNRCPYHPR